MQRAVVIAISLAIIAVAALIVVLWPRDPNALPRADWRQFKARFVDPNGRVVDTGNGNVSHSEGQGYGMLFAVAYGDRKTFDLIWNWTQNTLRRKDDHLFSWRYVPEDGGRIEDPNNAADGDLLISWALCRAYERWEDFSYKQAAAQIVADFLKVGVTDTSIGVQVLPGVAGFIKDNGVDVNPSYAVFPAIEALASAFPAELWTQLSAGSLRLLELGRFGEWDLNANWIRVTPLFVEINPEREPYFGYDAVRVPLNLIWGNKSPDLVRPYVQFWTHVGSDSLPATINLRSNEPGPHPVLPGMQAIVDLTIAVEAGQPITVRDIPLIQADEPYYSASLKLLTKLAIRDRSKGTKGLTGPSHKNKE